ncbi:unnamed protein product [Linum trigynum]|uniref:Replication factor A C-terminal domain-containing protein n=1 Tax=Linum trigynum TaxID=586398 RepID=A0AAV2GC17_9ROSI
MQSNLISELSAETPGLVLHGRICRKWKPRNPNTDRVLRLDMICLDRKGDAVWIQVPKSCMDRFDQRVEEQNTYRIANFKVVAETKGYRPVPNGLFVELESTSTIEPTPDHVPPFPTQCFRFLKHEDMFPNRDQRTILLDVVGQLLEFSKTKSSTSINRNSKRKEIKIMLPEGIPVKVVLWGRLGLQLEQIIDAATNPKIILIISSVMVSEFNGELKLSSSSASVMYDNLDVHEVNTLRDSNDALDAPRLHEEKGPEVIGPLSIQELKNFTSDAANLNKIVSVTCKVDKVLNDWFYDGCTKCPCKVQAEADKFYCNKCQTTSRNSVKRFRVQVSVNDPTGEAVFVLFDGEGKKFFGISAQALYADKENEPSDVPAALLTIEHMEVEFHIKVKEFNVKKSSHEFTVWKINEAKESVNSTTKISEPIQENTLSSQQGGGSTHSISTSTVVDIEDEDFDTTNRSNPELRHNANASATPSTNNLKRKQRADSGSDDSDV